MFDRLLIFESEARKVARWAIESPEIETGGDLYGYYSMERRPIVLLATGPGPRAQHSPANFVQDPDYLRETFGTLARRYRLFYLGDWHSHHSFEIDEPSGSDDRKIADLARKNGWPQLFSVVIQTTVRQSRGQHACEVFWNTFAHIVSRNRHERERIEIELIAGSSPIAEVGVSWRGAAAPRHESLARHVSPRSDDERRAVPVPDILAVVASRIAGRLPSSEIEIGDMTSREALLLVGDREAHVWVRVPLRDGESAEVGINDAAERSPRVLCFVRRTEDDIRFGDELSSVVESMCAFAEIASPEERTSSDFRAFLARNGAR